MTMLANERNDRLTRRQQFLQSIAVLACVNLALAGFTYFYFQFLIQNLGENRWWNWLFGSTAQIHESVGSVLLVQAAVWRSWLRSHENTLPTWFCIIGMVMVVHAFGVCLNMFLMGGLFDAWVFALLTAVANIFSVFVFRACLAIGSAVAAGHLVDRRLPLVLPRSNWTIRGIMAFTLLIALLIVSGRIADWLLRLYATNVRIASSSTLLTIATFVLHFAAPVLILYAAIWRSTGGGWFATICVLIGALGCQILRHIVTMRSMDPNYFGVNAWSQVAVTVPGTIAAFIAHRWCLRGYRAADFDVMLWVRGFGIRTANPTPSPSGISAIGISATNRISHRRHTHDAADP